MNVYDQLFLENSQSDENKIDWISSNEGLKVGQLITHGDACCCCCTQSALYLVSPRLHEKPNFT